MSVFPPEVNSALEKMNKEKIKAGEFEKGLVLQFVSVEKQKSQWGASEDSSIVEKGILEEGEQFLYTFKDSEGDNRRFYSHSFPFLIAMQGAELNEGDWLNISRTGKLKDTKYTVEKTTAPAGSIKPEDIPFD